MEGKNIKINKVKNRCLKLSPTVASGMEPECSNSDFLRDGSKPIGRGGFGEVWKVTHKVTKKLYVIKVISKKNILKQNMVDQMNREVDIMYQLDHPHIIKLVNHFEDDEQFYLIMHFASKGQLYNQLKKQKRFDERTSAQYLREVISALDFLHNHFEKPIIHRDIKPENILVDSNNRMQLADFGWSNYQDPDQLRETYCGTPEYLAPEMLLKLGHDKSVDIWSLGILLFEFLTGYSPFVGATQEELYKNIKKNKIIWPSDFPMLAKNLISKILKPDPKDRITLEEIQNHQFFKTNEPIREVLEYQDKSKSEMLESHIMSYIPESEKKISMPEDTTKEKVKTARQTISRLSTDKSTADMNSTVINSYKETIAKLSSQNEDLKKENNLIKIDNENLQKEISVLKVRDGLRVEKEAELIKTKEELEQYRLWNKDRLNLLSEIEQKGAEIRDITGRLKEIEVNYNGLTKELKQKDFKLVEAKQSVEDQSSTIALLRVKLRETQMDKDNSYSALLSKIEILQARLLEGSETDENISSQNITTMLQIINDNLKEDKAFFSKKISNIETTIKAYEEYLNSVQISLEKAIEIKSTFMIEYVNKIKAAGLESNLASRGRVNTQGKQNDRIEWFKQQIADLLPFKQKHVNISQILEKVEAQSAICSKKLADNVALNIALKINVTEKNIIIKTLENEIKKLESRLSDVKDFVFKNCVDLLDEFALFYKK